MFNFDIVIGQRKVLRIAYEIPRREEAPLQPSKSPKPHPRWGVLENSICRYGRDVDSQPTFPVHVSYTPEAL